MPPFYAWQALGAIPGISYTQQLSAMTGRDYYSIMLDAQFTRKLVHVSVCAADSQESGSCSPAYSMQVTSLGSDVSISGLEHSPSTGLLYGYAWSGAEEVFYSIDPLTASVQVVHARVASGPQPSTLSTSTDRIAPCRTSTRGRRSVRSRASATRSSCRR